MDEDTTHPTHALLAQASANRLVLGQIADKWSILILTVVCIEPARFNAIKRRLNGITHKALAEALRRLDLPNGRDWIESCHRSLPPTTPSNRCFTAPAYYRRTDSALWR